MAGWVKVNMDAALFQDESIGVGCVMCDSNVVFVGTRCCRLVGAWTPREAETIGMKEAYVIRMGIGPVSWKQIIRCL